MKKLVMIVGMTLLVLSAGASNAERTPLRAGAGKAEIVVPVGLPLAGYFDRVLMTSEGVHDPVFSRALVLEAGGRRVGLICADILMISKDLRDDLLKKVGDLKLDQLDISATHTHYSLGGYIDQKMFAIAVGGPFHPEAREILLTAFEKSLRAAAGSLQPAKLGAGFGPSPGVSANRRHRGGATDPKMRVLGVWSENGALIAMIMNHAIHPTTLPSQTVLVSGDCTGRAEAVEEERHPGAVAMFMNAGEGDQSPLRPLIGDDWQAMQQIGDALANRAEEVLQKIAPADQVELRLYHRTFAMPPAQIRYALECFYGLAPLVKRVGQGMVRTQGEIMGLGLDSTLFLFSPAEIGYDIQAHLEAMFPDQIVFVVAQSNDWYGYVITPEDYDTGGYESCMNLYGREFGPQLEREFRDMVEGRSE